MRRSQASSLFAGLAARQVAAIFHAGHVAQKREDKRASVSLKRKVAALKVADLGAEPFTMDRSPRRSYYGAKLSGSCIVTWTGTGHVEPEVWA